MISDIFGYGTIFIALAILGYIIGDIYDTARNFGLPKYYTSNIDKTLHYITNGILALSFMGTLVFAAIVSEEENFLSRFVLSFIKLFDEFHNQGLISDTEYITISKFFILFLFFSIIFLFIYFIVAFIATFFTLFEEVGYVIHLDNFDKIKTRKILQLGDFIYVVKNRRKWEAIRKEHVVKIEQIQMKPIIVELTEKIFHKIKLKMKKLKK